MASDRKREIRKSLGRYTNEALLRIDYALMHSVDLTTSDKVVIQNWIKVLRAARAPKWQWEQLRAELDRLAPFALTPTFNKCNAMLGSNVAWKMPGYKNKQRKYILRKAK